MNVDSSEIKKFNAISEDWWNPQGAFKPLHEINPLRLKFITHHAVLSQKKVLDVGCGGGILTEALARLGAFVTGIDMSANAITQASSHAKQNSLSIDYVTVSAEAFANTHLEYFDVITCMELLEHVPDPNSVIQACASMLKPGGYAFFSTLNRNLKSFLQAIIGAEYVLKLIPRGTHTYEKFIRPAELAESLRRADLELLKMQGLSYQLLQREYKLTDNIDVNYLVACRKN